MVNNRAGDVTRCARWGGSSEGGIPGGEAELFQTFSEKTRTETPNPDPSTFPLNKKNHLIMVSQPLLVYRSGILSDLRFCPAQAQAQAKVPVCCPARVVVAPLKSHKSHPAPGCGYVFTIIEIIISTGHFLHTLQVVSYRAFLGSAHACGISSNSRSSLRNATI